jgi:hypothetical protein
MNHNLVINVIDIYKRWVFDQLTIEREYLNHVSIEHGRMYEYIRDVETRIYFEEDGEARDMLRLELRNYQTRMWNSGSNLYELEQDYNYLIETIDEENERLDEIVRDINVTEEE